jgi:hypothetical protein
VVPRHGQLKNSMKRKPKKGQADTHYWCLHAHLVNALDAMFKYILYVPVKKTCDNKFRIRVSTGKADAKTKLKQNGIRYLTYSQLIVSKKSKRNIRLVLLKQE